jgi:hypothetical protein
MEIRLIGDTPEKRFLRLQQDASLLVYGRPGLPDNRRNAVLSCKPPAGSFSDSPGAVECNDGSMIDLQRVRVEDLRVQAMSIDNTGSAANEKVNVSDCRFEGIARVIVNGCDTPAIVNNTFTYAGEAGLGVPAINAYGSPLAEIRGNQVTGKFPYGVMGQAQIDSLVQGNIIEKCSAGIYWYGTNAMIKENLIKGCDTGITVTSMSGLMEDNTIDGAKTGINVAGATIQVTGLTITNLQKDGLPIDLASGQVTLVNTNLTPEQVKIGGPAPKEGAWVETMQYLVVGIKGNTPRGAEVEVVTRNPATPLKEGAADLNVRNSPAAVTPRGMTPLPSSLRCLIVKSWWVAADGKLQAEPEYTVRLVAPPDPAAPDAPRKAIKEIAVKAKPLWYRAKPGDAEPTVEIEVP